MVELKNINTRINPDLCDLFFSLYQPRERRDILEELLSNYLCYGIESKRKELEAKRAQYSKLMGEISQIEHDIEQTQSITRKKLREIWKDFRFSHNNKVEIWKGNHEVVLTMKKNYNIIITYDELYNIWDEMEVIQ